MDVGGVAAGIVRLRVSEWAAGRLGSAGGTERNSEVVYKLFGDRRSVWCRDEQRSQRER